MDVSEMFHIVQLFMNVTDKSLKIQIMGKMSQGSLLSIHGSAASVLQR